MYIITGSEGFIGTELKKYLLTKDISPLCYDLKLGKEAKDITPNHDDIVIHLAASTSVFNEDLKEIEYNNIQTFIEVVNKCKAVGCKLIYASSSTATNPTSLYGLTKKFDEDFAQIYYPNAVGLRFYNAISPSPRKGTLLANLLEGNCVLYNNGQNKRHFTYVGDIIKGILQSEKCSGGVYTICNPEYITIKEFADMLPSSIPYTITSEIRKYDSVEQLLSVENVMDIEYTPTKQVLSLINQ